MKKCNCDNAIFLCKTLFSPSSVLTKRKKKIYFCEVSDREDAMEKHIGKGICKMKSIKIAALVVAVFGMMPFLHAEVLYQSDFAANADQNPRVKDGVFTILNEKAWDTGLSVFDDECDEAYRVTLQFRFIGDPSKGFVSIDISGENGSVKIFDRPAGVRYVYNYADKSKKGKSEDHLGKMPPKTLEDPMGWKTLVVIARDGEFTAEFQGERIGSFKFDLGVMEKVGISAAVASVEIKDVKLETIEESK